MLVTDRPRHGPDPDTDRDFCRSPPSRGTMTRRARFLAGHGVSAGPFFAACSHSPRSFSGSVIRAWQDTGCDQHQHHRERAYRTMCDRWKACSKAGSWLGGQHLAGMISCRRLARPWTWVWLARGRAQATRWTTSSHVPSRRPRISGERLADACGAWCRAPSRRVPRCITGPRAGHLKVAPETGLRTSKTRFPVPISTRTVTVVQLVRRRASATPSAR
jgi:hypothetical protein